MEVGDDAGIEVDHAAEDFGEDVHQAPEFGFVELGAGEAGFFVEGEEGGGEGGGRDDGEGEEVEEVVAEIRCRGALEELYDCCVGSWRVWGIHFGYVRIFCVIEWIWWSEGNGFCFDEMGELEDDGLILEVWKIG